jgi:hypothetical protein
MIRGPAHFYEDGDNQRFKQTKPKHVMPMPVVAGERVRRTLPPPSRHHAAILTCVETLDPQSPFFLTQLLDAVAAHFGVAVKAARSERRMTPLIRTRMVFYYMAREHSDASYERIGKVVGGRDHSTVMHGYNTVKAAPARFAADIEAITALMVKP